MTSAGSRPNGLEVDTVSASTRIETAERVTGNVVVRTTRLGTVTGTTVRGTATEYAADRRNGGSMELTLTSFKSLVQYPRGPASSGPINKSSTEGTVNRNLRLVGRLSAMLRIHLFLLVSLITPFRTFRNILDCLQFSLLFLGREIHVVEYPEFGHTVRNHLITLGPISSQH